jgi:hypothetical protein
MTIHVRFSGGMPMPPEDADFSFTIDFEKGAGDPRRIFDSARSLIEGFELADAALANVVAASIQPVLVLEDIETGSLRVWLKAVLDRVPDEAIKDFEWKKAVGHYLLKAKYLILKFCDDEGAGKKGLEQITTDLQQLARDTDVRHLPDYAPVHQGRLVAAMDQIQDAKRSLGPNDKLIVSIDDKTYDVDLNQTWEPSEIIPVANTTETYSEGEVILTIRKPDLLGSAMWQFRHGKSSVSAPISDEQWLQDFHNHKIPIYSGDALRAKVRFTYVYDEKGDLIESKIEVMKVLGVIRTGSGSQGHLFDEKS